MIEIRTISGYEEVGRNMTALRVDDDVIIFDMGLELETYIRYVGDEDISNFNAKGLIRAHAIPDDSVINDWKDKVKAIILTHAHLDHIGAVPFLASKYKCPVIGTPYTIQVLKGIIKDNNFKVKNELKSVNSNSSVKIGNLDVELVHVTHSTPQTAMIAVHTHKGVVVYANDYKLDRYPVLGKKTNIKRLTEIGKEGVLALIVDSTRARENRKTPSESVARDMLRDIMLGLNYKGKLITVTTFSSHLARLKSIVHFAKILNRKIVFLGRSLHKYAGAGDAIKITNFSKSVKIINYSDKVKKFLNKLKDSDRGNYVLVVTGHQGEKNSILWKIANNKFKFKFYEEDPIIFSCKVIPTETNIRNREILEEKLLKSKVRIFKDIHVSGHACKEDHRELINMLKPKHIIPSHGSEDMRAAIKNLAIEMGYSSKKIHMLNNKAGVILEH